VTVAAAAASDFGFSAFSAMLVCLRPPRGISASDNVRRDVRATSKTPDPLSANDSIRFCDVLRG
jgi:hypothetical protein